MLCYHLDLCDASRNLGSISAALSSPVYVYLRGETAVRVSVTSGRSAGSFPELRLVIDLTRNLTISFLFVTEMGEGPSEDGGPVLKEPGKLN